MTAALIPREGRLFLAQRPANKRFGLLWEFPGGKVEPGESLEASLVREIQEELSWSIQVGALFASIRHQEPGLAIELHAFWCAITSGELTLREHTTYAWVDPKALDRYALTAADRTLATSLAQLPALPAAQAILGAPARPEAPFH